MKSPLFSLFSLCAGVAFFAAACSSDSSSNAEISEQTTPSSETNLSSAAEAPITEPESSADAPAVESSSSNDALGDTNSSGETAISSATTSSATENSSPESSSATNVSSSSNATSSSSESKDESKYLWHDEFDSENIDTEKWAFEIGTGASGWGNNEWEYYTDRKENAYIKDGILHIRANKEDYEGSKYTSARMITKGKFNFTYGTVEARIALPVGKGIWPAFWLLGQNIDAVSWPACGEIDIIETVNSENVVYGTNHWANGSEYATYSNNTGNYRDQKFELDVTQFHNYKFTWDDKYIRMFVDDFMYHEILIENNTGDTEEFHKPFFFILNVAVAGNWPGFEVDDSQFPNEMLVDYIRVTQ